MPLDPEALYVQLGHLIASMPEIPPHGGIPPETHRWLGRAYALVKEAGEGVEAIDLRSQVQRLTTAARPHALQQIQGILFRVLAVVELRAPATAQGAFIPAGNSFDAMAAIAKVLQPAASDVLIVDPYMDEKALTDFAVLAQESVPIRLLADAQHVKATLKPAATRWGQQHGQSWPLDARLSPARTLHDRLIIIDHATAWVLTQSLNAFAARAPASIVRTDPETAALKVASYAAIWQAAAPL